VCCFADDDENKVDRSYASRDADVLSACSLVSFKCDDDVYIFGKFVISEGLPDLFMGFGLKRRRRV
jgi:hypothetical protein